MFNTTIDHFETFVSIQTFQKQTLLTSRTPFLLVVSIFLAYALGLVLYRLYLHPLHRFPGPRLAAISNLYELYFDYAHDGQSIFKVERMHRKYGRINPREIHISDPEFQEQIYAGGSKRRDKDQSLFRYIPWPILYW
ncbi:unnamed protein product [Penicillium nalgiovense]|nr:unnamed protein product [Penicillium nalgiovense]